MAESHELYIALLAIEWQISQRLFGVNGINWDQVIDYFLKVCKQFVCLFIFTACFGPHTFVVG